MPHPCAVGLWLAAYILLAILTPDRQASNLYSHLLYGPVLMAALYWGRRAAFPATVIGAMATSLLLWDQGPGAAWSVARQTLLFVAIAFCGGTLSDRLVVYKAGQESSEGRYRLLIEKSLTGILIYRHENIIFASPRLGEMLGCRPSDLIGKRIWDLIHEQDQPTVRRLIARRQSGGPCDLRYECRFLRANGTVMWADVASTEAIFEGKPAVMVNAYDITDRKQAEDRHRELSELTVIQEEQLVHSTRLAELGEMAAAVAHELNQPLTGIKNYAKNAIYMIENGVGEQQEIVNNVRLISDQVDRAARIINQMRQLTRRAEPHFARVGINGIVRDSVDFVMPQFRLSGVEVSMNLTDGLPDVLGDRIRLEQVFLNLLTNARQAMEETSRRQLRVRTYFEPNEDCSVVVEIKDSGKGFVQDDMDRLFTPFYSTKKVGQGTGLGLSISLSIVKEHKGEIEAFGEPGKGAVFRVRLPAADNQEPPARSSEHV